MRFSAAAAAENFQFFSSLGNDGWEILTFFLSVGVGWKFFGSRHQRLKFFEDLLKKFLSFQKFSHKKSKE
jgi:hypothetical protein